MKKQNNTLNKNDEITVTVEGMSSEGSGIARYNGLAIFVFGAALGDEIVCRIIKVKKNYCIGKIVKIIEPSSVRIEPDCPSFPSCGGCSYRHISFDAENELKLNEVKQNFARIGKLDVTPDTILFGNRSRYRNKAQYPIRKVGDDIVIGFFAPKSHRVVQTNDCALQPESFAKICETVKTWIAENDISVYSEDSGKGLVRHLYLRKAFATGQTMVCLVINGETIPRQDEFKRVLLECDDSIKTIVLNKNFDDTNVVLGKDFTLLYGDGYIEDILCQNRIRISPLSFYQVNHDMCEKLYETVKEFAKPTKNDICLDLYCGTGTIGLSIARDVKELIGVEIVEDAVRDAEENARINDIYNARFICSNAADAAKTLKSKGKKPTICIVDPPRKGVDRELIDTIVEMNPDRVVYVSCDSATLARDVAAFDEEGYKVQECRAVNMFPSTVHVETVVRLSPSL